jgi:hypothetical protein
MKFGFAVVCVCVCVYIYIYISLNNTNNVRQLQLKVSETQLIQTVFALMLTKQVKFCHHDDRQDEMNVQKHS